MREHLPAVVLTAHEIFSTAASPSGIEANTAFAADALVSTLRALKGRGYEFTTFGRFMDRRRDGGVALLTFDDALKSVLFVAAPALAAERVPAVIFVITGATFGDHDPFPIWLQHLRDGRAKLSDPSCVPIVTHPAVRALLDASGYASLQALLSASLGICTEAFRKALSLLQLQSLAAVVAASPAFGRLTMTEGELRQLVGNSNVEIGVHSVTHRSFALLSDAEIDGEVARSADAIARWSGQPASALPFAYPYGAVTAHAERIVGRTFRAGFTCHSRPLSLFDASATLPRINLDHRAMATIESSGSLARLVALAGEKTKLHLRTGPAWSIVGPVRNGLRTGKALLRRKAGAENRGGNKP